MEEGGGVKCTVTEGDLTLGGEHTMQHIDEVLQNLRNFTNQCHPSKFNKKLKPIIYININNKIKYNSGMLPPCPGSSLQSHSPIPLAYDPLEGPRERRGKG